MKLSVVEQKQSPNDKFKLRQIVELRVLNSRRVVSEGLNIVLYFEID